MTAVIDTKPAVRLTPAQSRARWAKIRELNRNIMADRVAGIPYVRNATGRWFYGIAVTDPCQLSTTDYMRG